MLITAHDPVNENPIKNSSTSGTATGGVLFERPAVGECCRDAETEQVPNDLDARFLEREGLQGVAPEEVDAEVGGSGAVSVVEVHEVAAWRWRLWCSRCPGGWSRDLGGGLDFDVSLRFWTVVGKRLMDW